MSYIGNVPTTASFPFDQFNGTGSQTAFTLSQAPASTTSIAVTVSGVVQNPNTYSVSGTTLTFTGAPPSGTNNIGVLFLGLPAIVGVPSVGVVTPAMLSTGGPYWDASGNLTVSGGITSGAIVSSNVTAPIQPITASVSGNALTITLNPTSLNFRSSTLSSGTVNTRTVSAAISLTVSSGSTLGTVSAQQSRLVVIAIDNAGTVELAVVNISGGNQLDETNLISTTAEGGAGGADSANVIYSTTARTNVPYRVVGFIQSTQTTAGTWATAPSTIQGYGGQALAAMSSLGYGQTWQDLTASRALATTYYNTTGRPIMVIVGSLNGSVQNAPVTPVVNGVTLPTNGGANGNGGATYGSATFLIPPSGSYSATVSGGSLSRWSELR